MSFHLDPMTPADYPEVMTLWQRSSGLTLREADSQTAIAAYLARNPGLSFVAREQDVLLGAILVGTDGRRGYLQHLTVAEAARGRGMGKALLAAAIDALQKVGIGKTHLMVHADNDSAMAFYRHLGWEDRQAIRLFSFNASGRENC